MGPIWLLWGLVWSCIELKVTVYDLQLLPKLLPALAVNIITCGPEQMAGTAVPRWERYASSQANVQDIFLFLGQENTSRVGHYQVLRPLQALIFRLTSWG